MVHEIERSIISITEELEYISTSQILVNQINFAAHKCTVVQNKNETPLFISMQIIVEK